MHMAGSAISDDVGAKLDSCQETARFVHIALAPLGKVSTTESKLRRRGDTPT